MKVFDNETISGRSIAVPCYGKRTDEIEPVNVFIQGLQPGDSISIEAMAPDGTWLPVAGSNNPVTVDGMYVVDAGANVISLLLDDPNLDPINAWIEPDTNTWRDTVRKAGA